MLEQEVLGAKMFVELMHVLMVFLVWCIQYALRNWLPVNCYSSIILTS